MTPPRKLIYVGKGDFLAVGEEFLGHFVRLCALEPGERVLDVGCGVGRMAVPLTQYLSKEGSYDGFDIVPSGIEWCQKQISTRYPNFTFKLIDVNNSLYNPAGRSNPDEIKFPYGDEAFDFVFLASVFTHMLPRGVERYLSEIARVLRRGGRCLITAFLVNDESERYMAEGVSPLYPRFNCGSYRVISRESPEITVFHDQESLLALVEGAGLGFTRSIEYGAWCGRSRFLSYQDILVVSQSVDATGQETV